MKQKDVERFWSKVDRRGEDDCWEWTAGKYGVGYGAFKYEGKTDGAHRIAFELVNGALDGLQCCHTCDNRACCNPKHLFRGTAKDNAIDRNKKGRHWAPSGNSHYTYLHPEMKQYGERNGGAKLTVEDVRKIREMRKQGIVQRVVASLFGIDRANVSHIERGKSWKE